jgi:hypothetical protein
MHRMQRCEELKGSEFEFLQKAKSNCICVSRGRTQIFHVLEFHLNEGKLKERAKFH